MASDDTTGTEESSYPGLAFTPPKGTVEDGVLEGEALVKWKKVGSSYTLVEFEGSPMGAAEATERPVMEDMEAELETMDEEGV